VILRGVSRHKKSIFGKIKIQHGIYTHTPNSNRKTKAYNLVKQSAPLCFATQLYLDSYRNDNVDG